MSVDAPTESSPKTWWYKAASVTSSLIGHGALIIALLLFTYEIPRKPETIHLMAAVPEEDLVVDDFLEAIQTTSDAVTETGNASASTSGAAGTGSGPGSDLSTFKMDRPSVDSGTELARLEMDAPTRPLSTATTKIGLTEVVPGLMGTTMESGSVAGSVDRVTAEIVHQLTKGPVLVVWLFDASGSLRERRDQVVERFDRVNKDLQKLGKLKEDILLSAVVTFGRDTHFITDKPTADFEELQAAVRSIKEDESGEERVFSAIRQAAQKYRKFQTQNHRTVMMIVLTDETGEDLPVVDECIEVVQRNKIPVYVLGPMAPFGRKQIDVPWIDQPTGEVFNIPIDRGPESLLPEHLALPYWAQGPQFDTFPSGFGPYGLSLVSRMSGGLYLLFDDGKVKGPRFDRDILTRYAPEYMSLSDYSKMLNKHPLRRAVAEAVKLSEGSPGQPRMGDFPADDQLNPTLSEAQKTAAATESFVDRAITVLSSVEKERKDETSPRWQAHYDLMMGRLLATRIRCNEYNWALAQMKVNPTPPGGKNNRWRLIPNKEIKFGKTSGAETKGKKKEPKGSQHAKEDADKALALLDGVVKNHPNTPWAAMAERELSVPLGFKWESYYQEPPAMPKPGEPNKAMQREEAMKRMPKY